MDGIPHAPRGIPQIEVTFDIDANGIVNVSAKDKATSKEQSIRIEGGGSLSDSDIQQMVDDAEKFADEDRKKRELIEAKNGLDTKVYQAEKMADEYKDKISEDLLLGLTTQIGEAKAALESDDLDQFNSAAEALTATMNKAGEAMYNNIQNEATATAEQEPDEPDDVVDAEFEDNSPE